MNKSPAFQFYPDDFLADEKVILMNTEQIGAYCLLLFFAAKQTPQGTLPSDDKKLACWSRMTLKKWLANREIVMSCFLKKGERFYQKRLRAEFVKQRNRRLQLQEAGRLGGLAKAKHTPSKGASKNLAKLSSPSPTPSPTPNKEKVPSCPFLEIQEIWNSHSLPKVITLTDSRRKKIHLRWREHLDLDEWSTVISRIAGSEFCCGQNDRSWKATLDWLVENDTNWVKVMEGKYDNEQSVPPPRGMHYEGGTLMPDEEEK